MDKRLNRISLLWGVPGLLIQTFAYIVGNMMAQPLLALFFLCVSLAGTALLLIGLAYYSKAKGHSPWWGLVGILSCLGILILAALPDRLKDEEQRITSVEELDLPDGTQSPFGSRYEPLKPE